MMLHSSCLAMLVCDVCDVCDVCVSVSVCVCVCALRCLKRSVVSSRGRSAPGADAGALAHHGGGKPGQMAEEGRLVIHHIITYSHEKHLTRAAQMKLKGIVHFEIKIWYLSA